ncbi:HAD family hydrolase [Streptomyces sp. MI02-7b]|uniref:HAD family hydrolase n=1 Tax=Streptomyces sp. MI02-7b TaxID=462941 RepID=UPI0029B1AA2E|nr:HAD family hydrolase [Streptomyces sp. MI02-7b]MDX3075816.1 HAD family hydrolase [Streptomyces sp. MI02-7b]
MPLMLLDLDNTLVDRDAAFRAAVAGFLAEHDLPSSDLTWVMATDASGYTARHHVLAALTERYGDLVPADSLALLLDHGGADHVVLAPAVREALLTATAHGWTCVIVSNGRTAQQEAKILKAGLDQLVHGWVISESVGHNKPQPQIFQAAADAVRFPLPGAWVIGDSPHADIAGASALGLRSVWVTDGRPWTLSSCAPTHIADDVASAIEHAIATSK